ncbi:hypothetical protein DICPUDRAFT_33519 [Dictyostelium purpureum]|uniref:GH15-like domain-containing protein n=1 Tax=Dictyostelium purpureum TaxID=5786 RepID=F0ZL06_DICPU|nr:uncharacterized protein DICPUDRAFT_33519 [Dictyostelium purpureum]EGC35375.1 hypothetical protein DICPUDRAFT_33519 [Dictyostelium purpureum]|eukprot:XP_003288113.1 hypothetical protein DICPUDRAFT_33519 [Dictyostelium purpureum]
MPVVENKGLKWLVRKVKGIRGQLEMKMVFKPSFNFARDKHQLKKTEYGYNIQSGSLNLDLISKSPLVVVDNEYGGQIESSFLIKENDIVVFIMKETFDSIEIIPKHLYRLPEDTEKLENEAFISTIFYWQKWLEKCTYKGRWREIVERSALALKLMTFEPTGAIIASPTCSLPEGIGGQRNWDYRYCWLRDCSFSVYGLIRIGFTEEAHNFMRFLEQRCADAVYDDPNRMPLRIMYSIHGESNIPEIELNHLSGYRDSKPVRIGNDAVNQVQMDIFGELMDSIYLSNKYGSLVSYDFWLHIRNMIDWVAENYHWKDEGIWEVRSGKQHFVYSKIMCWVALDRGLRLADRRSFPAPREKWTKARDTLYEEIQQKGYDKEMHSFTQYYGGKSLDASTLIMSLVFFMAPSDPRNINTLKAILKPPEEGGLVANSLVFRYNLQHAQDGLDGEEGTFNICTFWLIEGLTRAGKYNKEFLVKARLIFDEMLGYANHLGLFSEELGIGGESLGNFPQAFTHLSLISAAFNLDRVLSGKSNTNA